MLRCRVQSRGNVTAEFTDTFSGAEQWLVFTLLSNGVPLFFYMSNVNCLLCVVCSMQAIP